ncbi:hypothetical protein HAX54_035679, partial [Datura stramonium]|nr:hypothetical protein [Datura stramonium]
LRGSVKRVGLLAVVNDSPKKEGGVAVGLRVFRVVKVRREEKREEGDLVVLGLVAGFVGEGKRKMRGKERRWRRLAVVSFAADLGGVFPADGEMEKGERKRNDGWC